MNEGEQSLPVTKTTHASIPATSNTLEAGVQMETSYKQLVDASTCVGFPEKPLHRTRMQVNMLKDDPDIFHLLQWSPSLQGVLPLSWSCTRFTVLLSEGC